MSNEKIKAIGVVGAGSWGTALSHRLAALGFEVKLWSRSSHIAESINQNHINPHYLSHTSLHPGVQATHELKDLADLPTLCLAVPAQSVRMVLEQILALKLLTPSSGVIITAKGIEKDTHMLMSQVATSVGITQPVGMLSGPTFALEVATGLPVALTLSSKDSAWARLLRDSMHAPSFKVNTISDIVGAQICGIIKNIVAIGAGIVEGLQLGENAKAIFVATTFNEMMSFVKAMGGDRQTCFTYCGLADFVLTTGSATSRNMRMGVQMAQAGAHASQPVAMATKEGDVTAEGLHSASGIFWHLQQKNIQAPLLSAVIQAILDPQARTFSGLKQLI